MNPDEKQTEPTLPPAEQMRARRLAALGALVSSSPSSASTGDKSEGAVKPSSEAPSGPSLVLPPSNPRQLPEQPSTEPPDPTSKSPTPPPQQPTPTPAPDAQGTAYNMITAAKRASPDVNMRPVNRPQKIQRQETLEEWADKTIKYFFRVTVDPDQRKDAQGHPLTYISNTADDLREQAADAGIPLLLPQDHLDAVIMEATSAVPLNRHMLDYLIPCWKRINRFTTSTAMQRDPPSAKVELVREAKRLCMSNVLFALTVPDLFGRDEQTRLDSLVPHLLRGTESETGIDSDFLADLVARFPEDESYVEIVVNALAEISKRLSQMSMADNFKPHMDVLVMFSKYKQILEAVANDSRFLGSSVPPQSIETLTILGPFFRLSPMQPAVAKSYFPGPENINEKTIRSTQSVLQMILATHQMELSGVVNNFVRVNETVRGRLLDWFALIVNSNHKRRAMQVNTAEVSSDGFMLNVAVAINELCQPFMDSTFSKIDRIDINYLHRNPRVWIADETKLNADQKQSDAFYAKKVEGTSNFISEVFFLGLAAQNYGTQVISDRIKNMERTSRHFRRTLDEFIADRPRWANNPAQLRMFEQRIVQYQEALDLNLSIKHATVGVLSDEKMQAKSLQFMRYVSVWLLRVASQSDYTPGKWLKIPLASAPPEEFGCLPEYALQIVLDNFKFVFNTLPQMLLSSVGDELSVLCITFLESSEYIRNPYMKAALVTLLQYGVTQFFRHWKSGVMTDVLMGSKFANEHLLHALMKFYIECESTGANSAFYDKFNIRYEISYIIQKVWPNTHYHQQLIQQSKTNRAFFVRFVNMLLNDATYVLDEALGKFHKIHELQVQLKEPAGLTEDERRQKQDELATTEGHATSYMHLTNQTIAMMKLFTEALSDAFTMPEIVQRLAGMLDYNLETLVGPKSGSLKVEDPKKYRFDPRTLLAEITDIYLNLGRMAAFIEAVAADGRSYKPETFEAAARIMVKTTLADPEKLAAWAQLQGKIAAAKELADQAEQDFGEIPAEYEDPLMSDLMKDPVRLPSGNVVDRSTIVQHLLSDPKDPFTRQPMTIEDVVPCDDLRAEIEAWKAERTGAAAREKLAAIAEGTGGDAMDTTE